MVEPFMSHNASAPLLWRQRMSSSPLPVKSPIPATLQDESGETALPWYVGDALDWIVDRP